MKNNKSNLNYVNKKRFITLALASMVICGGIIGTATNVKASQIEDNYYSDMIYVDEDTNKLSYQDDKNYKENNNLLFIDSEKDDKLLSKIALGVSCLSLGVAVADCVYTRKNDRR